MSYLKCEACELCRSFSRCVSWEGSPHTRLTVISRNPGQDEEALGSPFVGPAGQVLTMLLAAVKLKREDVYITNLVKAFTPKNREPNTEEIMVCTNKFLENELTIIDPLVVMALGSTVINYFVGETSVSDARKKKIYVLAEREFVVIPSWHPAFLVRNGIWNVDDLQNKKKNILFWDTVEDYKRALKAIEIFKSNSVY